MAWFHQLDVSDEHSISEVAEYVEDARVINVSSRMGQLSGMEGGHAAYRISKTALNALTVVMAKEFIGEGIRVNAICPGWVRTDMGGPNANKSIEEGADMAVWLATADKIENGKFYADRKVIPW